MTDPDTDTPQGEFGPQASAEGAEPPTEEMAPEQQAQARVQCVQAAADEALAVANPYTIVNSYGTVSLCAVTSHTDGNGAWWVDVWLAGVPTEADPSYRIYNPPLLVEDPNGDQNVGGTLYRLDPIGAVAEVVGMLGGATRPRRR